MPINRRMYDDFSFAQSCGASVGRVGKDGVLRVAHNPYVAGRARCASLRKAVWLGSAPPSESLKAGLPLALSAGSRWWLAARA